MHTVEVSKNGVELGKVRFRGIAPTAEKSTERRLFKSSPKDCVPKSVARKIADRLSFGVTAGHEDEYEWHT